MYCSACGTPNPDGSAFCTSCGKPLAPVQPQPQQPVYQQPVYQQPVYQQPVYQQPVYQPPVPVEEGRETFASHFRLKWRKFVSSPFALIVTILYTICFLMTLFQTFGETGIWNYYLNDDSILGFLLIMLTLTPGLLTTLGMWLLYGGACKRNDDPLNTSGLRIIQVIQIIIMVFYCILVAIVSIGMFTNMSVSSRLFGSFYYGRVSVGAAIVVLGVLIFGMVIMAKTIAMIAHMRDCALDEIPSSDHVMFVAVMQFISGGLMIVLVLISGVNMEHVLDLPLNTLLQVFVMPFLFGVLLINYKSLMDELEDDYIAFEEENRQQTYAAQYAHVMAPQAHIQMAPTGYGPAWKRAKTEQAVQTSTDWTCTCGRVNRSYVTTCSCGKNKREVMVPEEKPEKKCWYCPECGTPNDADTKTCTECGTSLENE